MNHFTLNGRWTLQQGGKNNTIPATVPGCVHTDLLASGLLEDPFYRDNELKQMWIGESDWHYRRLFDLPADFVAHDRVVLRCHGLDTLATIRINGREVGKTENMFRTWEFDVKSLVQAGENSVEIDFAAPMPYARRMDAEKGKMAGWVEPMRINSGAWIRKEPCNFGWDWGPKMVTSGIWRDIELVAFDTARLADVRIDQQHGDKRVDLKITLKAERLNTDPITASVEVLHEGRLIASVKALAFVGDSAEATLTIADPKLWWPNGMGAQPLYQTVITLHDADRNLLDSITKQIGLRTLNLERHTDQWGESFFFACNGVPFFAKGANWIPASPYPGATTRNDYQRLVQAAVDAHMNMLRVWGGGIYEDDAFYELCDAHGITIWQDFMFACGTYPSFDAEFMANVKAEAKDNIRRLRHHPCIALWCGNNEIEQGLPSSPGWLESMSWADYSRLFDEMLPGLLRELAPGASYWPGSPHSPCGDRSDHANPNCGDTHLWGVWHGKEPFEWYRARLDRFCSEFGFQSFPEPASVREFTIPEDHDIHSPMMEHHQRSAIGNGTILHYMLDWFQKPATFEATLWLSQILQGMGMKYAVEHWRRNMPRTMGTLYWQHNDMWPAPSWSSLDWKGNWKALHYMARRFYAPMLISGLEVPERKCVEVHVTSDLGQAQPVVIMVTITDAMGKTLEQEHILQTIQPRSSKAVHLVDLSQHLARHAANDVLVWLELYIDNQLASENLAFLTRPKQIPLKPPTIKATFHGVVDDQIEVALASDVAALYVWLELPGARFSDNFIHLRPSQQRTILTTLPDGLSAATAQGAIKIRSVVDTYVQKVW